MSEAAQIFNPLFLKNMNDTTIVTELHFLADKLSFFGYDQFSKRFILKLKKEMKQLVNEAKRNHDLDKIKSTKQFKTRIEMRIKRKKINRDNNNLTWRHDDPEYARRIWEWWRPRTDDFPCHSLALRFVVLAQLSSCSVERVFSQLKLIQEICSDLLKEDMLNLRLLLQCIGDIGELLHNSKHNNA